MLQLWLSHPFCKKKHCPEGIQGSRGMELKDPGEWSWRIQLLLNSSLFISLPSYSSPKSTPRKRALKISFIQLPKNAPAIQCAALGSVRATHLPTFPDVLSFFTPHLEDGTPLSKWLRRFPNQFKTYLLGDFLTMFINHLLNGMILQAAMKASNSPRRRRIPQRQSHEAPASHDAVALPPTSPSTMSWCRWEGRKLYRIKE